MTLANGLRAVVQRVEGTSGVGVSVSYRVGFRTERPTRSGFAHLFEHMMFQGSRNVGSGEHFSAVQACGGVVNANTFPDSTDYYQVVPAEGLEKILDLEADRMGYLSITAGNLDTQRRVVKEEIQLQVAGKPYGGFPWTVLPGVLFDKWENAHNGYGELADLDAATTEDCADFFHDHYAPGNAVLAICGEVDPEAVATAVHRSFDHVPARPVPVPPDVSEPTSASERRGVCHDPLAPRPALAIGNRLPDARRDLSGYAAHVVLSNLLTTGAQARLRSALAPLGANVDTSVGFFGPLVVADPDTFVIVAHHPSGRAEQAEAVITRQLEDVAAGAASGAEAARAVACARTGLYQSLDSLAYRVRFLARGALLFGRADIGEELAEHVTATAPDAVAAAAALLAASQDRAVLRLVPGAAAPEPTGSDDPQDH